MHPAASISARLGAATFLLATGLQAQAAGGHHAVDDAAILAPGACEVEGWFARAAGGERTLHAGAACRVGPVELGAASQYARQAGASATGYGLQAKWAAEIQPGLAFGISVSPAWQAHERPRYQGTTVSGLLTWAAHDDVSIHLNLGRDLLRGARDENRSGVAAEWAFREGWSAVAERFVEGRTHYARAGLRWSASEQWSLDASHAARLRGPGAATWTFGVTWLPPVR